ncbi:MAG: ABC transporter permease [Chloroflexota bacterium]
MTSSQLSLRKPVSQSVPLRTQSQAAQIWRRFQRDKAALLGGLIILLTILVAVFAPAIAPADPLAQEASNRLLPIGTPNHLLGTDSNGRDILSRLIFGSRIALLVSLIPVLISGTVGLALGLLAGYYGGWIDAVIMRLSDIMLAFPAVLLAIAIVATLGPNQLNAILALTVVFVPTFARLVRSQVLALREQDFVLAARSIGAWNRSIIFRHILINTLPICIVFATLQTGQMIIFAAALSFLGLGVQPPTPDWGAMANEGRNAMLVAPWVTTIPGIAIFTVTMGFNLLGDGLRDALDPRMKV